ncbi:hypothetical protein DFH09DRAFT_1324929 [Mycena vulgaris]|nr:hypothetical protein DFH09DRAFT_1324929 [Mycena vulgaris]
MPSLPRLFFFAAFLSGVYCHVPDNQSRSVARLSLLQPLIRHHVQPRETTIRGLLGARQLFCDPGLNLFVQSCLCLLMVQMEAVAPGINTAMEEAAVQTARSAVESRTNAQNLGSSFVRTTIIAARPAKNAVIRKADRSPSSEDGGGSPPPPPPPTTTHKTADPTTTPKEYIPEE